MKLFTRNKTSIKDELNEINKLDTDYFRDMPYAALYNMGIKDVVNGELIFLK